MKNRKRTVLFLYASVGGGHLSVASAIEEELARRYGSDISSVKVDILDSPFSPQSLSKMNLSELYPRVAKIPELYNFIYKLTDGQLRSKVIAAFNWLYARNGIEQALDYYKPDLIISTFAFICSPFLTVIERRGQNIPFVTVVTDWGKVHTSWYDPRLNYCFVPTAEVYEDALQNGMSNAKLKIVGYPTASEFKPANDISRNLERKRLKWPQNDFVVLVMGGVSGMGGMAEVVKVLSKTNQDVTLAVVCGKNAALAKKLSKLARNKPSFIYGQLSHQMIAQMMRSADVLVSKSGGATVAEAINSHLPLITYDYTLEQERSNTEYIVNAGAGLLAASAKKVSQYVQLLQDKPSMLAKMKHNATELANPNAAPQIVETLQKITKL